MYEHVTDERYSTLTGSLAPTSAMMICLQQQGALAAGLLVHFSQLLKPDSVTLTVSRQL